MLSDYTADSAPRAVCPVVGTDEHLLGLITHMACISRDDTVVDIGCGDGRMLVHAARQYRCKCTGFDVRDSCLKDTRLGAERAGVGHLVDAVNFDIMDLPKYATSPIWSAASVIYAYLLPFMVCHLEPILRQAVDAGKLVILYCSTGSRVRRPGAPPAGNVIGDLRPVAQAALGRLRMYCNPGVLASRGVGRKAIDAASSKSGSASAAAAAFSGLSSAPPPALAAALCSGLPRLATCLEATETQQIQLGPPRSASGTLLPRLCTPLLVSTPRPGPRPPAALLLAPLSITRPDTARVILGRLPNTLLADARAEARAEVAADNRSVANNLVARYRVTSMRMRDARAETEAANGTVIENSRSPRGARRGAGACSGADLELARLRSLGNSLPSMPSMPNAALGRGLQQSILPMPRLATQLPRVC